MMELLFWIFVFSGTLLCFFYFLLILSYCYGWLKTKELNWISDSSVFVSIIVAARNEQENIGACLDTIIAQKYPREKFEIIVIDDHSDDETMQIVKEYSLKNDFVKYLHLPEGKTGKKNAIRDGIAFSKGELIITTDADCEVGADWVSTIVSYFLKFKPKMIVGPVAFHKERTLFEKMQSLEFMALVTSGGASLFYKKAILCNGANLAYPKSIFNEVGGFDDIDGKASGDDVLLMYKISDQYPGSILFVKKKEAIVHTKAKKTLREFIQQRKRWSSKGFSAHNAETRKVGILVYLFNFYLLFIPVLGGIYLANSSFYPFFVKICLILIGIKCFIDFLLLFLSASFFRKKRYLLIFIPEQVIYIFYVVIIGVVGTIGSFEWKGRSTK